MKRILAICLLFLFVSGCGGAASKVSDLERRNEQLTTRVKNLEDQLLSAEKKLVQLELAIQATNTRMKDMEGYFMRMQVSQSR